MSDFKRLIAGIGCKDGRAMRIDGTTRTGAHASGWEITGAACGHSLAELAQGCNDNGADGLLIYDMSETDEDHERSIGLIKETARIIDIPIITGGRIKRLEDVKKYLYAGAKAVFFDGGSEENIDLIREAANRFGSEKIYITVSDEAQLARIPEFFQLGAAMVILTGDSRNMPLPELSALDAQDGEQAVVGFLTVGSEDSIGQISSYMAPEHSRGVILTIPEEGSGRYMELKQELGALGQHVDILRSAVPWKQFKLGADGLIPVIVQDYKTDQVLMLAYMNEQAFTDTLATGKMHYYSRSRKGQWMKGETSGHFQYVKSLHLDCDNDTILAKVHQIGAACHTGARSCFFQTLAEKEYRQTNPLKVFEDVFSVIQDRKEHPKEGSYTNYLFDKGIDKILKKIGEEATEIVIAAKNPDPEEIKYEISDFLYHAMVLMAEKGVTWEEITEELANR